MSLISLRNVSKVFGEPPKAVKALDGIDLDIGKGEFVAIMGPSGSGKTTLLNILGAVSPPTSGDVTCDGVALYRLPPDDLADFRASRLGFVFQQLYLLPYLSALQNVMLPLAVSRRSASPAAAALEKLRQVGLEGKAARLPAELSAGEQARVAIARALVKDPPIILADEPTGNLDSTAGGGIVRLLEEVNRRGHSVIVVTHNRDITGGAHRRVYLRDGRIAGDGE